MADPIIHEALVIEAAVNGGYIVTSHGTQGYRPANLFAGTLDECFAFIRKSIRKVEAPKPRAGMTIDVNGERFKTFQKMDGSTWFA
jgi:hypothetical protein